MANYRTNAPGLVHAPLNPRDAQYDALYEVIAGGRTESKDWGAAMPPFKWQGWAPHCTAYVARSIIHAINKTFDNFTPIISTAWLFYKSGGQKNGNTLIAPFLTAKEHGVVLEEDKLSPNDNTYSYNTWDKFIEYSLDVTHDALLRAERQKISGASWVLWNNLAAMIDAMEYSPLSLAVPVHEGYFTAMNGWKERPNPAWHAVTVTKIKPDGSITIFDSLTQSATFDGFHDLPPDYPRSSYLAVRDLPTDWKEKQKTWLELQFPNAYKGYGLPRRPLSEEQAIAIEMRALVEAPNQDPRIRTLAGKYWIVLVSAATYGGYSYYVVENGKKYFSFNARGSDLANLLYGFMRTGKWGMNLDRPRNQQ